RLEHGHHALNAGHTLNRFLIQDAGVADEADDGAFVPFREMYLKPQTLHSLNNCRRVAHAGVGFHDNDNHFCFSSLLTFAYFTMITIAVLLAVLEGRPILMTPARHLSSVSRPQRLLVGLPVASPVLFPQGQLVGQSRGLVASSALRADRHERFLEGFLSCSSG